MSLTSSELLLQYIPDATVVKAFNNIYFKHPGPPSNEKGQPVDEDAIRAALATAAR